jgi:catechol 2,3-dioxygenase-like lactoylglutathione lyase family enzyme
MAARLVPELDVADLDRALAFYVDVIGCRVLFARPEERFAYLDLAGVHLMLEEATGPGRRFRTAPLEHPYGRGVNFMIEVPEIEQLHDRVKAAACDMVIPLEERWYRQDEIENGQRQFIVADPDGYLLRFFIDVGERPALRQTASA